jgi:hypothetical protein
VTARSLSAGIELKPPIFPKSVHLSGITLDHPSITLVRSGERRFRGGLNQKAENRGRGNHDCARRGLPQAVCVRPCEPHSRRSVLYHGISIQPDSIIARGRTPKRGSNQNR